ncbi:MULTISPECIES: MacA family efflux pump subunit [unclassified Acinetobacter]|jgi:macrolide-specific efflux system membrane fusion protein|uniref:MacA family efflux pump subunit n=1 Tax=unclassified Acinetobacter TaxID=196816 RepID=UPI000A33F1F1|nr:MULTISPECIES: MacA family efflux pump subunit [unclassified Acinetobacter]OTG56893.1 MacA family efflux pump subunit [Acinetobacter sp. ANC 4204]RGD88863.1 MacA family efflux pump subunit [Acinetobacter sp. SWAC57]
MQKIKAFKMIIAVLCIAVVAYVAWTYFKPKQEQPQYITESVSRGDLENTVLATGTLDATKLVSVGAQVSGQVQKMYVQLGDEVKQGQLIAQIDSTTQENSFKTAEANIKNLEAQRLQQEANLNEMQLAYKRQQQMYAQDATSKAELESAEASYKTAQAQIKAIDAQIESAKVTKSTAQTNIGYTRIVAPTDGTVVAIVTEEGQTVNANQSTPTIVKIAKLQNMTIKAQVSEADIMKVQKGQAVYFTTLGDDSKRYASLRQVEPAPDSITDDDTSTSTSTSTAIYYNALFDVPNHDGKLRIDMTAQVYIVLDSAKNALLVPSSALSTRTTNANRSSNSNTEAASSAQNKSDADHPQAPRLERLKLNAAQQQLVKDGKATVSVVRVLQADGSAQPKQVLVGINNRVNAQVIAGLKEGDQVVIADSSDTAAATANSSNRRRNGPPMGM